jgi:glycerol-3-phosphate acyltransferase PlsY
MDLLTALLAIVAGYVIGAVSPARLIAGLVAPEQDITKIVVEGPDGESRFVSDAVSSSSVRLHLGNRYGCLAGILDVLKGTVPALAFKLWMPDQPYYLLAAGMAVVGHVWPVFYRFQGGRGVSTSLGGMLVVDWLGVVVTNVLGLASDLFIRNTLISSGVWLGLMVPWMWLVPHGWPERIYAVAVALVYFTAMVPEYRELLRLKREGKLEKFQSAREIKVASRLDGGVAQQATVPDLIAELVARLRGKRGKG